MVAESGSISGGARSIEEYFASFAYKGAKNEAVCSPKSGGGGEIGRAIEAAEGLSPNTPPPPPCSRRKMKSPSSFQPSSFLRTTVGGKAVVVSKYFPLPPAATPPVVIDKRAVEKAAKRRMSMMKLPMTRKKRKVLDGERKGTKMNGAHRVSLEKKMLINENDTSIGKDGEEEEDADTKQLQKRNEKKKSRKQRSLLSAAEKKCDAYKRVSFDNTWEAPFSCYNLLQERHSFDPWRVLIICMLLNLTTGEQVKRVLPGLFLLCGDAEEAAKVPEEELVRVLQPLGLHRKRARAIKNFSREYLGSEWTHVTQLPGVGKYAADAYAIFCAGRPEDVIPEDHKLVPYWKFVCEKRGQEKMQQQLQCAEAVSSPLPH